MQEYTTKDGLPSNYICAIKEDANGYFWISTNYGISRFNPQNQSFINFYASDGLQSNEFSKGAAFADKQGELIFGGTNGITYFNPTEITTPDKKPEIRITDFYIHDKKVKKGMKSGNRDIVNTAVMDADTFNYHTKIILSALNFQLWSSLVRNGLLIHIALIIPIGLAYNRELIGFHSAI